MLQVDSVVTVAVILDGSGTYELLACVGDRLVGAREITAADFSLFRRPIREQALPLHPSSRRFDRKIETER